MLHVVLSPESYLLGGYPRGHISGLLSFLLVFWFFVAWLPAVLLSSSVAELQGTVHPQTLSEAETPQSPFCKIIQNMKRA